MYNRECSSHDVDQVVTEYGGASLRITNKKEVNDELLLLTQYLYMFYLFMPNPLVRFIPMDLWLF